MGPSVANPPRRVEEEETAATATETTDRAAGRGPLLRQKGGEDPGHLRGTESEDAQSATKSESGGNRRGFVHRS